MDYQVKKDLLHIMHNTVSMISKNTYTHTHTHTHTHTDIKQRYTTTYTYIYGLPRWSSGKEPACQCR